MFVKIERRKGHKDNWHNVTYECDAAGFHPNKKESRICEKTVLLILEGMKTMKTLTFELEKNADTKVFFLNNEGKTIDYYKW